MKVGEYARTKWGCIAKFEGINEGFYEFDNIIMDESSAVREELFVDIVKKSSPNIIDLIEIEDYVNKIQITSIENDNKGKYVFGYGAGGMEGEIWFYNNDIKSVLTHEQFSQMEYRIGE